MFKDKKRLSEIDSELIKLEKEKQTLQAKIEKEKSNYERFLQTYNGKRLLETHSLNELGIWKVYGEDPNCDFGGPHYEPELGLYEGQLEKVIRVAVELRNFWQWGAGGNIKPAKLINVQKV